MFLIIPALLLLILFAITLHYIQIKRLVDIKLTSSITFDKQTVQQTTLLLADISTTPKKSSLEGSLLLLNQESQERTNGGRGGFNFESLLAFELIKYEKEKRDKIESLARDILINSIWRQATAATNLSASNVFTLENSLHLSKIIGKDGRNIKAFENASGVNLVIEENSVQITISSFDPIRRAMATQALEALIRDGRITPSRIEEELRKSKANINITINDKGKEAVYELGLSALPSELYPIIGMLYYRTSYGQNILEHSVEMAYLAKSIGEELGLDTGTLMAAALLHDIGKAVDHTFKGSHVDIGVKILRKYGVNEKVITAMKSHHEEYPFGSSESYIIQAVDAISAGRQGARSVYKEESNRNLKELEKAALEFEGVDHAFAVSGGREIRVFVKPSMISDEESVLLAFKIASTITSLSLISGDVKVIVIRETRAVEIAR